ncbi:hypothetical protein RRG08_030939 [Elysia crispata]|uniref:Uncharacterized protein n=1 Tax=Elysia crispata TaxID=231223 RepID=A0AAE1AA68_9GAST|nr:hypothetical protein RRG08_030939 [Elysia crispata]
MDERIQAIQNKRQKVVLRPGPRLRRVIFDLLSVSPIAFLLSAPAFNVLEVGIITLYLLRAKQFADDKNTSHQRNGCTRLLCDQTSPATVTSHSQRNNSPKPSTAAAQMTHDNSAGDALRHDVFEWFTHGRNASVRGTLKLKIYNQTRKVSTQSVRGTLKLKIYNLTRKVSTQSVRGTLKLKIYTVCKRNSEAQDLHSL